jgi:hypothetical protein
MSPWKKHVVLVTIGALCVSFSTFLVTGYTALYWAWVRANLKAALPYLPWARNFGMLAIAASALAFGILISSKAFPISTKVRLVLSILATATIAFFAEFRNDGKFYFKNFIHFSGPGTWIHTGLNQAVSPLGDFLYRMEYSHWNDFLMGPAIVSVLFALGFAKIYAGFRNQNSTSLGTSASGRQEAVEDALRFARILMNVGLFWFFIQAWAEKAGYYSNSHSSDEVDLPFEFAGVMVGFWMARLLTKPFGEQSEKFRSTFFTDLVCSGVVGLLYTFIVGPLTEAVARGIVHGLSPVVPHSLEVHEYTPLQRHMRPLELLLLAGAVWWGLNASSKHAHLTQLCSTDDEPQAGSRWEMLITIAKVFAVTTGYLLILVTALSIMEPEGWGWTLVTAAVGMVAGTTALLLVKRGEKHFTAIFGSNGETSRTE